MGTWKESTEDAFLLSPSCSIQAVGQINTFSLQDDKFAHSGSRHESRASIVLFHLFILK